MGESRKSRRGDFAYPSIRHVLLAFENYQLYHNLHHISCTLVLTRFIVLLSLVSSVSIDLDALHEIYLIGVVLPERLAER